MKFIQVVKLAVLSALVSVAVVLLAREPVPVRSIVEYPEIHLSAVPATEDSGVASVVESSRQVADSSSASDQSLPSSTTPAPQENAVASTDLEEKYAGMDVGKLMLALQAVMAIHGEDRKRLIDQRWELGLYEQQFVQDGESNAKLPSPRAADGSFPSYGFKTESVAGGTIVKTAILHPEEYPEFAAIERELKWLRARTGAFPPPLAAK